jgi:hypothetical protein
MATDSRLNLNIAQSAPMRKNILSWASIILIGCLFYVFVMSNWQQRSPASDELGMDELVGLWVTSAPGYQDRYFSITKSAIVFGAGANKADGQPVRNIEAIPEGSQIFYTIAYGRSKGEEQFFSFYYDRKQKVITFRNQSHLRWKKKIEAS